jgi:transglutaminase-like putative cysteine protease
MVFEHDEWGMEIDPITGKDVNGDGYPDAVLVSFSGGAHCCWTYHIVSLGKNPGATHAWVEAYLGDAGWVAFDPTNNLLGCERHIRVALGRGYADVPPTRGVYKGEAESELSVRVAVSPVDAPEPEELPPTTVIRSKPLSAENLAQFEQQQQQ